MLNKLWNRFEKRPATLPTTDVDVATPDTPAEFVPGPEFLGVLVRGPDGQTYVLMTAYTQERIRRIEASLAALMQATPGCENRFKALVGSDLGASE